MKYQSLNRWHQLVAIVKHTFKTDWWLFLFILMIVIGLFIGFKDRLELIPDAINVIDMVDGVTVVLVLLFWFHSLKNRWVESLDKRVTMIAYRKDHKEGDRPIYQTDQVPLSSEADLRAFSQQLLSTARQGNGKPPKVDFDDKKTQYADAIVKREDGSIIKHYTVKFHMNDEHHMDDEHHSANRHRLVIISDHAVTIDWIKTHHVKEVDEVVVIHHLDDTNINQIHQGDRVIGNLPLDKIVQLQKDKQVTFDYVSLNVPQEWRHHELSVTEFNDCEPKLFRVQFGV